MKKLTIIIVVLLQFGAAGSLKAQIDPHFSQYYAYPLWLNPALTGVIDGDTRINANFKDQWANIGKGYRTAGLSFDHRATEKVGLGLNVINQAAGTAGYNYFALYGSFGYGISVSDDESKKLHFGVQAGLINRSFDPSKLQFDNQYNPGTGYDPNLPNFENFSTTNATVFDASAGVFFYDGSVESRANIFGGVSVAHLTATRDPFAYDNLQGTLPMRYTVHGGVRIHASDFFDVTPHAVYVSQRKNQIKGIGIYSELKVQENSGLLLGGMIKLNDAAIANVGYHVNNLVIGLSYDVNTSALKAASNSQGGFELSLSYSFRKRAKNPAQVCPRF